MTDKHLKNQESISVLMICMGNICRSPTAEAVLRQLATRAGMDMTIDSAGTLGYHTGSGPDARARAAGGGLRARRGDMIFPGCRHAR